jgi:hypothetical protein
LEITGERRLEHFFSWTVISVTALHNLGQHGNPFFGWEKYIFLFLCHKVRIRFLVYLNWKFAAQGFMIRN